MLIVATNFVVIDNKGFYMAVKNYTSNPETIMAEQITQDMIDNEQAIASLPILESKKFRKYYDGDSTICLVLTADKELVNVKVGDWIIEKQDGSIHTMKSEEFHGHFAKSSPHAPP